MTNPQDFSFAFFKTVRVGQRLVREHVHAACKTEEAWTVFVLFRYGWASLKHSRQISMGSCRHETEENTSWLWPTMWLEFHGMTHCLGWNKVSRRDSSPTDERGVVFCEGVLFCCWSLTIQICLISASNKQPLQKEQHVTVSLLIEEGVYSHNNNGVQKTASSRCCQTSTVGTGQKSRARNTHCVGIETKCQ